MSNGKGNVVQIPNLPAITSLNGSELMELVQSGTSYKGSVTQLATFIGTGGGAGVSSLAAGSGIGVSAATGAVTVSNTGVTSIIAGSNISVNHSTGAVTISATGGGGGVTSLVAGSGIGVSGPTGAVTVTNSGVTSLTAGSGIGVSAATGGITVSNNGVTSIIAGTNVTIDHSTGAVTINASVSGGGGVPVTTSSSTSYVPVLGDANGWKQMTSASAIGITIPPNSSVAYSVGDSLIWEAYGGGTITVAAGVGVTLNASGGKVSSADQFSVIQATQTAVDVWNLFGDRA